MRGSALLLDRCQVASRPDRDLHPLRLLQWRCAGTDSVGRCLAGPGFVEGGRSHWNDAVRVRLGPAGWIAHWRSYHLCAIDGRALGLLGITSVGRHYGSARRCGIDGYEDA